jgi:hypothetical protein
MDATNSPRERIGRWVPWLVIALILLSTGFIRVRLLDLPLERDEGEYAYAGQLIRQGIPPYQLASNMKLPGTYFAYAAGMAVFGETPRGIHLTLLVANSATVIFMFLLGRKLSGPALGLAAAAAYAVMSISVGVLGLAAHATQFVALFAVAATWQLCRYLIGGRWRCLFFSGLLYGLAFLMKQQGIMFGLFGAACLFRHIWPKKPFSGTARVLFVFGLGAALPLAGVCLYLALAGVFPQFWFWTFEYARSYVGLVTWPVGWKLLLAHLRWTSDLSTGFWLLAVAGLVLAWRGREHRRAALFIIGLWLFSFVATAMGLYFRDHYFVMTLPAFALAAGLGVAALQLFLQGRLSANAAKTIPIILLCAVSLLVIIRQKDLFFRLSPEAASTAVYGEQIFIEAPVIARFIQDHSAPDARIAVFGSEPEFYFYARRHSATAYIYLYALFEPQPYALRMQQEMESQIETNRPEWLVYIRYGARTFRQSPDNAKVFDWFDGYAEKFYERTGVVTHPAESRTDYRWEADARAYAGPDKPLIEVFKRKRMD